ncbi:MAG TPA: hypothetical protein VF534_38265 [Paraburkholderia sp.]
MSPLRWNTLDEAALWLSEVTGEAWSPRRILNDVLNLYRVTKGNVPPPTCLRCAPPHGTTFGRYKWDAKNGTPSNSFVYVCDAPYQTVALYPSQVDDLLKTGETRITLAEESEDAYGREGDYVFVEPMAQGLKVGVSSVGMGAVDLQDFAGRVVAAKRASNDASSTLDVGVELTTPASDSAMKGTPAPIRMQSRKGDKWTDSQLRQLLHESMLPEMTQQKLADQYGVTRQRMSRILEAARGKLSKSRPVSVFTVANANPVTRKRRNI